MEDFVLDFDVSEKGIFECAQIVKEFVPFLEEMKMYYYFPFLETDDSESIRRQISKDSITFDYIEAERKIKGSWKNYAPNIVSKLRLDLKLALREKKRPEGAYSTVRP